MTTMISQAFLTSCAFLVLPFEVVTALVYSLFVSIPANLGRIISKYLITALNRLCIVSAGEFLVMIINTLLTQDIYIASSECLSTVFWLKISPLELLT